MEHEYEVLTYLKENEIATQRKISKRTGLSLGAVNILLKKMVRKGLVKVEKLSARSMRYILTPRSMQEKSSLTYQYIRKSYKQILKINHILDDIIRQWEPDKNGFPVVLYGPADEIRKILTRHLSYNDVSYELYNETSSFEHLAAGKQLDLLWREEEEKVLDSCFKVVNIMNML